MKIVLDDPIWGSLYGPYGVEPVPEILAKLLEGWDEGLASDLFWSKLHHQETLYPVTYAAVPWLWQIAQDQECARTEVLVFLANVISLSRSHDREGQLNGLPLRNVDQWQAGAVLKYKLTAQDFAVLGKLEKGYLALESEIAQACLAQALVVDEMTCAWLLKAPAHQAGAADLAYDVEIAVMGGSCVCPSCRQPCLFEWVEDQPTFELDEDPGALIGDEGEQAPPDPAQATRERQVARDLAARFPPNHKVARFLTAWADWSCCDG